MPYKRFYHFCPGNFILKQNKEAIDHLQQIKDKQFAISQMTLFLIRLIQNIQRSNDTLFFVDLKYKKSFMYMYKFQNPMQCSQRISSHGTF